MAQKIRIIFETTKYFIEKMSIAALLRQFVAVSTIGGFI